MAVRLERYVVTVFFVQDRERYIVIVICAVCVFARERASEILFGDVVTVALRSETVGSVCDEMVHFTH